MTEQTKPALPEWQADMVKAVPDRLVRDIVADHRRGSPRASSPAPVKAGSGWVTPTPLGPRPASELAIIDRLCERFIGGPNKVR